MIKKAIFIIACVVVAIALALGGYFCWSVLHHPKASSEVILFTIKKGQRVGDIAENLEVAGFIKNSLLFKAYLFISDKGDSLQAGGYELRKDMSLSEIAAVFVLGDVTSKEARVTIVEGMQAEEVAEILAAEGVVSKDEFLDFVEKTDTRDYLPDKSYQFFADKPSSAGVEGFLFPDTYLFYKDSDPALVIGKMLDNFDQKLTPELRAEIKSQHKTIFEIITLASIIEKEARKSEDRKILAGVFYKRMEIGMALQSDATINYITQKGTTRPTLDDLAADSKYNTYKYRGLPPGPICNPSLDAITAAIYPKTSDFFYFITAPDGSSSFSKTYEEHLEKKKLYYGD